MHERPFIRENGSDEQDHGASRARAGGFALSDHDDVTPQLPQCPAETDQGLPVPVLPIREKFCKRDLLTLIKRALAERG
jgi:hypothetical protein